MLDDAKLTFSFEAELMAAFGEIEKRGMPQQVYISGRPISGVIRKTVAEAAANEVGFEPSQVIVIVATRDQFGELPVEAPDGLIREIVNIPSGPYAGKYVVVAVKVDAAHYTITCTYSD